MIQEEDTEHTVQKKTTLKNAINHSAKAAFLILFLAFSMGTIREEGGEKKKKSNKEQREKEERRGKGKGKREGEKGERKESVKRSREEKQKKKKKRKKREKVKRKREEEIKKREKRKKEREINRRYQKRWRIPCTGAPAAASALRLQHGRLSPHAPLLFLLSLATIWSQRFSVQEELCSVSLTTTRRAAPRPAVSTAPPPGFMVRRHRSEPWFMATYNATTEKREGENLAVCSRRCSPSP